MTPTSRAERDACRQVSRSDGRKGRGGRVVRPDRGKIVPGVRVQFRLRNRNVLARQKVVNFERIGEDDEMADNSEMCEDRRVDLIIEQGLPARMRAIVAHTDDDAKAAAANYVHFESKAKSVGLYRCDSKRPDLSGFIRSFKRTTL